VRKNHIGEQVYASVWAAMMAEDWRDGVFDDHSVKPLSAVLNLLHRRPQQRQATVAATIVTWLGCNVGQSILLNAKAHIENGRWLQHEAYLLAWTLENTRRRGINYGIRSIEYMLSPPEAFHETRTFGTPPLKALPNLSALDLEVCDAVMLWLGTERGQRFLRQCESEISRLTDEERRARDAEWRRNNPEPSCR
jgi:hypothetical protein